MSTIINKVARFKISQLFASDFWTLYHGACYFITVVVPIVKRGFICILFSRKMGRQILIIFTVFSSSETQNKFNSTVKVTENGNIREHFVTLFDRFSFMGF